MYVLDDKKLYDLHSVCTGSFNGWGSWRCRLYHSCCGWEKPDKSNLISAKCQEYSQIGNSLVFPFPMTNVDLYSLFLLVYSLATGAQKIWIFQPPIFLGPSHTSPVWITELVGYMGGNPWRAISRCLLTICNNFGIENGCVPIFEGKHCLIDWKVGTKIFACKALPNQLC